MAEHGLMTTIVREMILQDHRLTIQDLCNTLGLSYGTCQRILSEELNMRRIAVKFVPRLLHTAYIVQEFFC
jgi:hypothetical protein